MPVHSKKQAQGQTGKKGDDARLKAKKEPHTTNYFGSNDKTGSVGKPAKELSKK